jgi:hypothetical protein
VSASPSNASAPSAAITGTASWQTAAVVTGRRGRARYQIA